ncbi:MAG: hypothetical protein QOG83_639 [Alphaproteobacteria bacterium]|jgi:hypothetical protein|nr:hypothetical protein [Alphaproteobacteria bacterium]
MSTRKGEGVGSTIQSTPARAGWRAALAGAAFLLAGAGAAFADDEIQVYNGEIAKVGEWTVQQHLNYAFNGRRTPDFPGGLVPHRTLNGTPEFAYGITPWWEWGFYIPWAINKEGTFYSNAGKLRTLFVTPDAEKREFFYGVNFEFAYSTRVFSDTRWNAEIRPIIGWRKGEWEFIMNPIVDIGFGTNGEVTFVPAFRLAKTIAKDLQIGLEYYTDLGPLHHFLPLKEQGHNIYGVVDFKVGIWDVNFGLGAGLTHGSDKLMAKLIVGTDLNNLLPKNPLSSTPASTPALRK